jgi:hypothetical protein
MSPVSRPSAASRQWQCPNAATCPINAVMNAGAHEYVLFPASGDVLLKRISAACQSTRPSSKPLIMWAPAQNVDVSKVAKAAVDGLPLLLHSRRAFANHGAIFPETRPWTHTSASDDGRAAGRRLQPGSASGIAASSAPPAGQLGNTPPEDLDPFVVMIGAERWTVLSTALESAIGAQRCPTSATASLSHRCRTRARRSVLIGLRNRICSAAFSRATRALLNFRERVKCRTPPPLAELDQRSAWLNELMDPFVCRLRSWPQGDQRRHVLLGGIG